jgi:Uma2 family endonuclease
MTLLVARHLFTVDEYHRMGTACVFGETERVELIEGEIVEMTPIGSRHAGHVNRLNDLLTAAVGRMAIVAVQNPLRLGSRSEPQPDLLLLRRRADYYASAHPEPPDVLLLVEVADTSLDYDRLVKIPLYARAAIPEVWLLDLEALSLLVHRDPGSEGYRDVRSARRGERLALGSLPGFAVAVDDVLG